MVLNTLEKLILWRIAFHDFSSPLESLDALLLRVRERQQNDFAKVIGGVAATRLGDLDLYFVDPSTFHCVVI